MIPLVTVLYFFFQLQADIKVNAGHIEDNMQQIIKMEEQIENMGKSMNSLVTDIKVMTVQVETMLKQMDRMEKKLEKE
tara:strand:+ start:1358 stop:1591 length:234 start_codon:yes stop_codon:yes gene_type:complete